MNDAHSVTRMLDVGPPTDTFLGDVLSGLNSDPRTLPCKYLYDQRGSQLFERICQLQEYYPTRTELLIMRRYVGQMAEQIGPGVMLIEYGSGSSIKTRLLLDRLPDPVAYVPVDISRTHLKSTADRLARLYPHIEVLPVCADFTRRFQLPRSARRPTHQAVYFPGSTIGNFQPAAARQLLTRIATLCGTGGGLLIGIDLQKDIGTLEAAYNDDQGVTAQFNLNLLQRINRELDADFSLEQFEHSASYDQLLSRIEMHLVSQCDQVVTIGDERFEFAAGEMICTEHSYKYTIDGFAELASAAGLSLHRSWTDEQRMFGVLHLAVEQ